MTFPYLYQGAIIFSITSIIYDILGAKPIYFHRDVSLESLYKKLERNGPFRAKNGNFLHPHLSNSNWWPYCLCQGNTHDIIIWKTPWYRQLQLWKEDDWLFLTYTEMPFCPVLQVLFIILGSDPPYPQAKNLAISSRISTLVAILPRESLWHHFQENPLIQVIITFILTDMTSVVSIPRDLKLKITVEKES